MRDLLQMLGVLRIEEFLDPSACRRLASNMEAAQSRAATVHGPSIAAHTLDEQIRRSRVVEVAPSSASLLQERLLDLKPVLESHFDRRLGEPAGTKFLTYGPGDFFRPHRDVSPSVPGSISERLISVVLFINDQLDVPRRDGYSGGSLVLYGLLGEASKEHGVPVDGRAGQLVAFRSDLVHEVTAVESGYRHSAVTWYPAPGNRASG